MNIWDGDGSREFLDSLGLSHHTVGDLGPIYGFQWRHFGAEYVDAYTDYTGQGVDQLADIIQNYVQTLTIAGWSSPLGIRETYTVWFCRLVICLPSFMSRIQRRGGQQRERKRERSRMVRKINQRAISTASYINDPAI